METETRQGGRCERRLPCFSHGAHEPTCQCPPFGSRVQNCGALNFCCVLAWLWSLILAAVRNESMQIPFSSLYGARPTKGRGFRKPAESMLGCAGDPCYNSAVHQPQGAVAMSQLHGQFSTYGWSLGHNSAGCPLLCSVWGPNLLLQITYYTEFSAQNVLFPPSFQKIALVRYVWHLRSCAHLLYMTELQMS